MARPDEQTLDFMPPLFPFVAQLEQQHAGKDDDDDEEDDDDLDDDDDADDDEDDDDDERTPEELRAELAKAAARLKRVNAEAKRHRLRVKEEREKKAAPKPAAKKADEGDDDVETRIATATAEATAASELRIKRVEAKSALKDAGVSPDRAARALKLLDLDDLTVSDDEVDGLEDAIESLREDFPELFDKPRRRRRSGAEGNARDEKGGSGPKVTKSASQRQAEQLGIKS